MTIRLSVSASIALDASGTGTLAFSPAKYRETWNIARYTTNGNSPTEPVVSVYRGSIGSRLIDTTKRGNADVSEMTDDLIVNAGELIIVQYTGGTSGAVMTFYIEGEVSFNGV